MWIPKQYDLRPIVQGTQTTQPKWTINVDPVYEIDGGTFYRPVTPNAFTYSSHAPGPKDGNENDIWTDTTNHGWYGPKGKENGDGEGSWPGPHQLPYGNWIDGYGVPSKQTGANGDYYLDKTNNKYYGPKTSAGWGSPTLIYDSWVQISTGLPPTGIWYYPGSILRCDETAKVEFMIADSNKVSLINDLEIAKIVVNATASNATCADWVHVAHEITQGDVINPGTISYVRFRITGGHGLGWSQANTGMGRLHE
jgi:hypothetical protein